MIHPTSYPITRLVLDSRTLDTPWYKIFQSRHDEAIHIHLEIFKPLITLELDLYGQ